MTSKRFLNTAPVLWLLLLTSLRAFGQDVTGGLNIGFPVNGDFSGSDFENVQTNNGNLHIEIPLYSEKGRGLGVVLKYVYDNKAGATSSTVTNKDFALRISKWRRVITWDFRWLGRTDIQQVTKAPLTCATGYRLYRLQTMC